MAIVDTPLSLSPAAQSRVISMLNNYIDSSNGASQLRSALLERDLIYYREKDRTEQHQRAQAANRGNDASKMVNPTVPVVAPQVETGLAYLTEVFLSSYPMFPVVAKPKLEDAALQIETILGESAVHFQWAQQFAMAMRDGLKYNLMAVEVEWKRDKVYGVQNSPEQDMRYGVPAETVFEGSDIKRIDMYNAILDMRVPPSQIHKRGDYVGYSELFTRIQLKQLFMDLDSTLTMNATDAFKSGSGASVTTSDGSAGSFYVPQVNPLGILQSQFNSTNWMSWAKLDTDKQIAYSDMYEVTTLYARVIPKELGINVKNSGAPQIYKFIIVNRSVVIFCQRKTNAHNYLPIIVGQPIEDGLAYQTKSYADQAAPYQALSTALYISAIQSQRRKVYDRIFYDPTRINKGDMDRVDPVARIAIKSEAYGKPITDAFAVVPYRDEGVSNILGIAREVAEMADTATGQNRTQRGQFQKGNKTRYEFETTMGNSDSRPRMMAVLMESAFFQPIKYILKTNILQYQPPETLYNRQEKVQVEIKPAELRKLVWEFQVADGVLPVDKIIPMELFGQAFQFFAAVPTAAVEWDITGMFMYQLKLQGARWVDDFRRTPQQQQQELTNQQATNGPSPLPQTAQPLPGAG